MQSFKIFWKILFSLAVIASLSFLSGCDAGSNDPVATAVSTGNGYKMQLAASLTSVRVGGTSTLTAVVFEPDGSPIRDGEEVFFAAERGKFSDDSVKTSGGTAVVTFTAGENPLNLETVTATCHGAISSLQIIIVPEKF
ncbi:MAG: hypothetical protein PHD82_03645 [Candidatus Riflebacteria bacterium]|nr:hypothetical protein [Candidatus Riflebacteria bacterium]